MSWKTFGAPRKRGRLRKLSVQSLEERALLYAVDILPWPNTDVSYSVVPDGTSWNTVGNTKSNSVWHETLSGLADPETWQRYVAIAFQTWANHSNLNFHLVSDDGAPHRVVSNHHGDIRIGSIDAVAASGWASFPAGGLGGDITINADSGTLTEKYWSKTGFVSLLTHEIGHAIGMRHSDVMGTVMGGGSSSFIGLQADDIAGIEALYGAREQDSFDKAAANDGFSTQSQIQPDATGRIDFRADLTRHADVDYYQFSMPVGGESFTVSADARQLSLLAPKVQVYDASQNLVAEAIGDYGTVATTRVDGLKGGENYSVVVSGATDDVFGMGAYRLHVDAVVNSPSTTPLADPNAAAEPVPTPTFTMSAESIEFTELLNDYRVANSVGHVILTNELSDEARINNQGDTPHNFLGQSQVQNWASGYTSPSALLQGWIDSPGHNANLLHSAVKYIGLSHDGLEWTFNGSFGNDLKLTLPPQPEPETVTPVANTMDVDQQLETEPTDSTPPKPPIDLEQSNQHSSPANEPEKAALTPENRSTYGDYLRRRFLVRGRDGHVASRVTDKVYTVLRPDSVVSKRLGPTIVATTPARAAADASGASDTTTAVADKPDNFPQPTEIEPKILRSEKFKFDSGQPDPPVVKVQSTQPNPVAPAADLTTVHQFTFFRGFRRFLLASGASRLSVVDRDDTLTNGPAADAPTGPSATSRDMVFASIARADRKSDQTSSIDDLLDTITNDLLAEAQNASPLDDRHSWATRFRSRAV